MDANITADGVIGNAVFNTNKDVIAIEASGTWDGAVVTLFKYMGTDLAPSTDSAGWVSFASISADAIGSSGLAYNIGTDKYYYGSVASAGGSTDVNIEVRPTDKF